MSPSLPTAPQSLPTSQSTERRYYIDVLRVLATLLLIFFHTARAFDEDPWHVKNDEVTLAMSIFVQYVSTWHMPLFFILAGASSQLALRYRTGKQFVNERIHRLLVPLLCGIFIVVPPQVYLERIGTSPLRNTTVTFQGSFMAFYPHFIQGIYPEGNFSYHHLWFVFYLFVFSLLLAPLFLSLRDAAWGQKLVERFGQFVSGRGGVIWLSVPIIVIWVLLYGLFPPQQQTLVDDWARDVHYLLLLVYGYLLMADSRCTDALVRVRRLTFSLALVLTMVVAALRLRFDWPPIFTPMYFVVYSLTGLVGWCYLATILGYGAKYLNFTGTIWRWASEIAYPFYIVHQTVIVVLAFFVVQWDLSVAWKFIIISAASLSISIGLCEVIKLSNVTRVMFGMKPKPGVDRVGQIPNVVTKP